MHSNVVDGSDIDCGDINLESSSSDFEDESLCVTPTYSPISTDSEISSSSSVNNTSCSSSYFNESISEDRHENTSNDPKTDCPFLSPSSDRSCPFLSPSSDRSFSISTTNTADATMSPTDVILSQQQNVTNNPVTYKIVGDNIDVSVCPRFLRVKKFKKKSLHMFHYYAAADRINLSGLCDDRKHQCLPSPDSMALSFLPSVDDDAALRDNISVLIARILIKHMPFMKMSFGDITLMHIKHPFSKENVKFQVKIIGFSWSFTQG